MTDVCPICEQPVGGVRSTHPACMRNRIKVDQAAFRRGAEAAALVAADYDRLSCHDHLVSDCILAKLNIRRRRPRRNPDKYKNSWLNGYGFGLAEVSRQGDNHGIAEAARAAGVSINDLKAAGLDPYDLKELRKTLPKPTPKDEPMVRMAKLTLKTLRARRGEVAP